MCIINTNIFHFRYEKVVFSPVKYNNYLKNYFKCDKKYEDLLNNLIHTLLNRPRKF